LFGKVFAILDFAMKIKPDVKEYKFLNHTIDEWVSNGDITDDKAQQLKNTIKEPKSHTQQIAQYFFFIALSCILLAFAAIFIDDKFIEKFKQYFSLTNLFIAILFTVLSTIWFIYLKKKKHAISSAPFEVYAVIGSLLLVTALAYYCKETGYGPKYTGFLLTLAMLLCSISAWLRSYAVWIAGVLAIMGWYGAFSTWQSNNDLFMGMNHPLRFAVFGILVCVFSFIQSGIKTISGTQRITYIIGLIILLTGLWGVSVFGNYTSLDDWAKVRQIQIIWYALLFAIIAALIFYYGIRRDDELTRDIGVFALLINLYTRYFEYFWDTTNKGVFFLILGISFWFIGKWIEKKKKDKHKNDSNLNTN
jgi:uncharacterized membrane protein